MTFVTARLGVLVVLDAAYVVSVGSSDVYTVIQVVWFADESLIAATQNAASAAGILPADSTAVTVA